MKTPQEMRARYDEQSAASRRAHDIEVQRLVALWKAALELAINSAFESVAPSPGVTIFANRFTNTYEEQAVWDAAVYTAQHFKGLGFKAAAFNGRSGPPSVEVSWSED